MMDKWDYEMWKDFSSKKTNWSALEHFLTSDRRFTNVNVNKETKSLVEAKYHLNEAKKEINHLKTLLDKDLKAISRATEANRKYERYLQISVGITIFSSILLINSISPMVALPLASLWLGISTGRLLARIGKKRSESCT